MFSYWFHPCAPKELHSCFRWGTAFQIGSSPQSALKCVEDPGYLQCDDSAEQVGRTGEFPDTFHIYHENEKRLGRFDRIEKGWFPEIWVGSLVNVNPGWD